MKNIEKICKYCGEKYYIESMNNSEFEDECEKCKSINKIGEFVSNYNKNHKIKLWNNEIHRRNMINNDYFYEKNITSYTLSAHKLEYRVEKRTKRVKNIIEKITFIREYLYLNLKPIFEILDSIYIKKDLFWKESGNLIKYVNYCCFQEVVLKLRELLIVGKCKYSVKNICNTLQAESRYVFEEQKIYERLEFDESKETIEEVYQPFDIESFIEQINNVLAENASILNSIKDYRDTQFAHIDTLKNTNSFKEMTYVNIKKMFNLAKNIYDGFLFAVAPDKYATIVLDTNIYFAHLNELAKIYNKYIEEQKENFKKNIQEMNIY